MTKIFLRQKARSSNYRLETYFVLFDECGTNCITRQARYAHCNATHYPCDMTSRFVCHFSKQMRRKVLSEVLICELLNLCEHRVPVFVEETHRRLKEKVYRTNLI
jgi:hypothetical protein